MNPTLTRQHAIDMVAADGITDKVVWLGLRAKNSAYGAYDDTIGLLTPDGYAEFKGNTLPSTWIPGIAKLEPGKYQYAKGLHGVNHFAQMPADMANNLRAWLNGHVGQDHDAIAGYILPYWAFRQHGPVTLIRDGATSPETQTDPAKFPFIDLHRGGWNGTSSAGCQTFYPDHWPDARKAGYAAMDKYGQTTITYSLHLMDA